MVKMGGAVMFTDQGTRSFPRGEGPARERAEVKDGRLRAQHGGVGFPATVWPRDVAARRERRQGPARRSWECTVPGCRRNRQLSGSCHLRPSLPKKQG